MQKLQRNFVESKMNKDLDDRFVPPGEYRDGLNISVITNTDSSSGAVQNSKGNSAISDLSRNMETKNIVDGAVSASTTVVFNEANEDLQVGSYLYSNSVFPNLLTNPSFDANTTGWTTQADSGSDPWVWNSGGYAEKNSGTADASLRQTIQVVANKTYVGSFRKKYTGGTGADAGRARFKLDLDNSGSGYETPGNIIEQSGDWVTSTAEFTPTFTGSLVVMVYMLGDGLGYIDDVSVKLKDTQPIIIAISDDKKTITLNTPVTLTDDEVVYTQHSNMLPNECVGAIEDEGEGSIYWMTSSRDDDDSRQFNFRNSEQRSNVNLVPNPNFQQGTAGNFYTDGWGLEDAQEHLVISSASSSDNYITIQHKAGSTAAYPGLSLDVHTKFEHGKRYKVSFNIASISSTGSGGYCPKIFLYGVTDPETGAKGVNPYRPVYVGTPTIPATGDHEYYFVFDSNKNNANLFNNPGSIEKLTESSNYLSLRIELTQGPGGYAATSYEQSIKIGEFSITEHDADLTVYQDTVFEYKNSSTNVVANDIYMIEAPESAPHFTSSANIANSNATFIHDAVTKDMTWQIVAKGDNSSGVPHIPFNSTTHAGIVSSVKSAELGLDPSFTSTTWATNDNTDSVGWPTNGTGVTGNGAGNIYWSGGNLNFNAVPAGKYIGSSKVNTIKGKTYILKLNITSITAGAIRVNVYSTNGHYWVTPDISTSGLYEYEFIGGSQGTNSSFPSQMFIQARNSTTTAVVESVEISDKFDLSVATLEPYSGTAVEFPTDTTAYKIVLTKPKVLDLNYNSKITGINIVEKMLFWTDGYSEPKKINIDNFKLGTPSLYNQSKLHTPQNNSIVGKTVLNGNSNGTISLDVPSRTVSFWQPYFGHSDSITKIKKEHVTVIRQAPHQPPLLELSSSDTGKSNNFTFVGDLDVKGIGGLTSNDYRKMIVGQDIWLGNVSVNAVDSVIVAGDILYCTQNVDSAGTGSYDLKFEVLEWYGSNDIKLKVLYINGDKTYEDIVSYYFVKGVTVGVYEDKFVRFGYRYQYSDGEYSSFSPFSRPAFLPNPYRYDAVEGVNVGMVNQAKNIKVKGFVPQDIPVDVVGVDLLYKDSDHSNVYKLKSFHNKSSEWNAISYGDNKDRDDAHLAHNGVYEFNSDNLMGALPSSQLLRSWDAVPKKAVAQEIVGNRLVYGNYTQNYNIAASGKTPDFTMAAQMVNVTNFDVSGNTSDKPLSSCKSLRSYQVGVVYGDYFGRETPILTTGQCAVTSKEIPTTGRLLLQARITSAAPSWAKYYRHYVKESSLDYHNLVLDRWWEAEDDTIWLSFFSHDRNKLDVGDEMVLKKKHGGNYVIPNIEKNKILAIENEAPDSCKLKTIKIATYNADSVAAIEGDDASLANGPGTGFTEHGFYGMSNNQVLPQYPRTGDVNEGEDYFDIKDTAWENSGFAGLENVFAKLGPNETLKIMFRRAGLTSKKYEVLNIQAPQIGGVTNVAGIFTDRYRITLGREIETTAAQIVRVGRYKTTTSNNVTTFTGLTVRSKVLIQAYVDTYELEDYHEGRFFVKVNKTKNIVDYVMCNGRNVEQREVMEMRLPYLAHNANYYSDGTTGMSTTSPDSNPGVSSVGTKSYISRRVWNSLSDTGASGGVLDGVTNGRKKLLFQQYESGNSVVDLTYNDIDAGLPLTHYSYNTAASYTATLSDPVTGGMHRGNTTWEDYFVRYSTWSNGTNLEDDFWFVDKESAESSHMWSYQSSTKDTALSPQLTNWTPLYKASDGSTTATHLSGLWTNTGSAEVPGPANNWVDNNPARLYYPTTASGGSRTNLRPWHPNYGSWQTSLARKDDHLWLNLNGWDYNNGDFTNGYTIGNSLSVYTPAGADMGRKHMTLSWAGTQGNPRNAVFQEYVYSSVIGQTSHANDEPHSDQPKLHGQCKFYWREDPDKEIYTIYSAYYSRHAHNYGASTGYSLGMNKRKRFFLYLDKPHGSGPSGWLPFYHPTVNPGGAIDAGLNITQPLHNGAAVDEFRTMVLLDNVLLGTAAHEVENAAIFETVPRASQDIDIYYESGGAIPMKIDGLDPETFVPYIYVGSKIEIDYVSSGNNEIFKSSIGVIDKDGRLGLQDIVPDDVVLGDSIRIYKTNADDAQYISSTVRLDPGNGYTSVYLSDTTGHGGWCGIPFVNCFNFQNGVESNVVKDLFNESRMSKGVIVSTSLDTVPKEEVYENGLIHSGIYNSKTGMNDFNQFIVADKITKDINPNYGSIQKLNTRDADMTVLCEDKVVRLLVNKNSLYNADGTTNVTASDLVLGQDVPYVGEYGISKNPESFVNYGYKSFFTDRNRGAVLRLSQDGLTTISKNGMESYFDSKLRGEGFLIGSYDAKKYEYNLTATLPKLTIEAVSSIEYTREITMSSVDGIVVGMFVDGENVQNGSRVVSVNTSTNIIEIDKDTLSGGVTKDLDFEEKVTVSFNDVSNGWSSFRSFIPEHGLSVRGEYFTYNNGTLYQHYTNDKANFFYNKHYNSSITAVFNDGPDVVKDFKVLEYLGTVPKNKTTEYGWYISSASTDIEDGYIGGFVEKEGKYSGYVKGFNTGYTDPKQFTTQGIGNITKIENA